MADSRKVTTLVLLGITLLAVNVSCELSKMCLNCICVASVKSNRTLQCTGEACGFFQIPRAYWANAGKPLLTPNDDVNAPDAYARCVNDPICAAKTVRVYMKKFAQDCDEDGTMDCYDYASNHRLGGDDCRGVMDDIPYIDKIHNCIYVRSRVDSNDPGQLFCQQILLSGDL